MLTFEKIMELYREEKKSDTKLQKMPEDFLLEASEYLKGSDETIKRVISDLMFSRQQKILKMALLSVRTDSLSKPANLMAGEESLFAEILSTLKSFRSRMANLEGAIKQMPEVSLEDVESPNLPEPASAAQLPDSQKTETDGFCLIKETMQSFMGTDMKTYHLKKGDKVYLPKDMREFLEKKGICERLN
jgi:DNA replication initiation complex subunit (GINS family)